MAFVKFLTVLDSFIWPLVTIVYPLHVSIRAIENNSVGDNRKCLMYWVTCGFIMLFEFTSAKLIQWIPFWFYIKLVATLLLVARHFDGAVYAYDHFVRPCFSINPSAFGYWLRINRDEFSASNSDNFVLLAKRFVQENGPEALEKVIDKVNNVEHKLAMGENIPVTSVNIKDGNPLEVIKLEGSLPDTGPEATATKENSAITEVNVARALENGPEALEKVIDKVNSVEHELAMGENILVTSVNIKDRNPLEVIKWGSLTDTGPEATATTKNSAITEVNVARALENGPEDLEKEFDKVNSVEHELAMGENILVTSVNIKDGNPLEVIKWGSLTDTGPEATATTENSAITEVNVARALENGPEALEKEFDKVSANASDMKPCFSMDPCAFGDWLRIKGDVLTVSNSHNFVVLAKRFVQVNGPEALEKVIDKVNSVEHKLAMGENIPLESVNIKEGIPLEVIKLECSLTDTGPEATPPTENSAITEINVARASEQHSQSSVPSNAQKEWTCALCQVCTPGEVLLHNHFQGKKHKANEEKLKGSKTQPIEKAGITGGCCELRGLSNLDNTERDGSQVYSQGDASLRDHLEEKEHKAMEKELSGIPVVGQYKTISATYFENTNTPKVTPKEGMHMRPQFIKLAVSEAEKKPAVGGKGGNCESPGSSAPEETQKKWTCYICQIFTVNEISLQQHFQGRKHKAKKKELSAKISAALNKVAALKCTSKPEVTPKGNVSASFRNQKCVNNSEGKKVGDTGTEDKQIPLSKLWCEKCKLQCNSLSMLTDHLGGKRHKGSNNAE